MKHVVALLVAVLLCSGVAFAQSQRRGAVDWIFLIDTSKSMRGIGGTKDIFGDVKASVRTFIGEAKDGDSIAIYTFDRGTQFWGRTIIGDDFDRAELDKVVDQLQANGDRTHLGLAIRTGLERSENLVSSTSDSTRARSIVLFTDGQEDVRDIPNPVSIPENVQRVQDSHPWIFFVSMGEHEAQLDVFANDPRVQERTRVMKPQDSDAIKRVADEIRQDIEEVPVPEPEPIPPPPPPEPVTVQLAPVSLDFGEVEPGESAARELTVSSDRPVHVALKLTAPTEVSMSAHDDIAVAPNAPAKVNVSVAVAKNAAPGRQSMTINTVAASGEQVPVVEAYTSAAITIPKPSIWKGIVKWALAILLALVLLVAGICLYRSQSPGELIEAIRGRSDLEGEIEIIAPAQSGDPCVGLPGLKTKEISLSQIVPGTLTSSDARLYCRHEDGEKRMWISRQTGALRVNDIEVPESVLYNSDLIEIDDAKLRFNWDGHDRPESDANATQEDSQ